MPMYNLTEYSDNYAKTTGSYGNILKIYQLEMIIMKLIVFTRNSLTDSFNFKVKIHRSNWK